MVGCHWSIWYKHLRKHSPKTIFKLLPKIRFEEEKKERLWRKLVRRNVQYIKEKVSHSPSTSIGKTHKTNILIRPSSCHNGKIKNEAFKGFLLWAKAIRSEKHLDEEIKFIQQIFKENGYDEKNKRYASLPWIHGLSYKLKKVRKADCKMSFKSESPQNLDTILASRNKQNNRQQPTKSNREHEEAECRSISLTENFKEKKWSHRSFRNSKFKKLSISPHLRCMINCARGWWVLTRSTNMIPQKYNQKHCVHWNGLYNKMSGPVMVLVILSLRNDVFWWLYKFLVPMDLLLAPHISPIFVKKDCRSIFSFILFHFRYQTTDFRRI